MAVTLSTVSEITKEIYEGKVREQLNDEVVALKRIERSSAGVTSNVGGRYVTFPIHYGRNAGIGARNEMEPIPAAGFQATAAAQLGLRYQYGSMALSGQTLALVDTNTQAFTSALDLETNGLKNDLAISLNRQVYGDGSGTLAMLGAFGSSVHPVTSGIDNLGINQVVDIWDVTDLQGNGSVTKTNVTIDSIVDNGDGTGAITLWDNQNNTAYVTSQNGKVLVTLNSARKEWGGLAKMVDNSSDLYGISPTNVDQWRSVIDTSAQNRALSEGRIIKNVDQVRKNGGKTSVLLTSMGVRRSYFALLVQQRQFVNTSKDNKTFEGGFNGLAFTTDQGEIPMVSDPSAPYNTMYGLSEKNLKIYREKDWSFMDRDGGMWVRIPASDTWYDAYSATMYQYSELGTDRRNVHFRIEKITEA